MSVGMERDERGRPTPFRPPRRRNLDFQGQLLGVSHTMGVLGSGLPSSKNCSEGWRFCFDH